MKNKKLENRIEKYCNNTSFPYAVYFTENPLNFGGYEGYKYFFCYHNTHTIVAAFKSQREIEEYIDEKEYEERIIEQDNRENSYSKKEIRAQEEEEKRAYEEYLKEEY